MAKAGKKIALPKTIGACADLLYKTRQERLETQKQVSALEDIEKEIKTYIIETLPKSEASGVAGKLARVSVATKEVPKVEDWEAFYKYIKKTGAFELLGRKLANHAIKERWENGKDVPGVTAFQAVTVSLNKL